MSGFFEHLAYTEQEDRGTTRKAVALARARVERQFGRFVRQAHDQADKDGRLALVAGELEDTVRQACADVGCFDSHSIHEAVVAHLGGDDELHKLSLRKPKMCPYHREVMDISLASGDPASGFSAMAQHAWSGNHCQGPEYEGERCKFKPEMATQSYWDTKAEKAEERRQERQQQQEQALEPQLESQPVENDLQEPDYPEFETDFEGDAHPENSDLASDVSTEAELGEPVLAARYTRVATAVVNGMWHGGTMKPLAAIHKNTGGQLAIDGQPFDQWQGQQRESNVNVEVTHPNPTWERIAADCLQQGHDGPLKKYMMERKQQREQQAQPQAPQGGPGGPVQASTFRESEALTTVDVTKGGDGPSPKIDKGKWTPENVKWDKDAQMDGSPNPTHEVDIKQPVKYEDGDDDGRFKQTDTVTEKQDVGKDSGPKPGKGGTFPKGKQADPVTSKDKDPDLNPIQEAIQKAKDKDEDDDDDK